MKKLRKTKKTKKPVWTFYDIIGIKTVAHILLSFVDDVHSCEICQLNFDKYSSRRWGFDVQKVRKVRQMRVLSKLMKTIVDGYLVPHSKRLERFLVVDQAHSQILQSPAEQYINIVHSMFSRITLDHRRYGWMTVEMLYNEINGYYKCFCFLDSDKKDFEDFEEEGYDSLGLTTTKCPMKRIIEDTFLVHRHLLHSKNNVSDREDWPDIED